MNKLSITNGLILFALGIALNSFGQPAFFSDADNFLKKHVLNGTVNYEAIKANPAELKSLEKQIAEFPLTDEVGDRNKSFYINAYNILVIKQVIDHYPINSPMDVGGFFESNKFEIAGDRKTLNQIENEILRPVYKDARLHFVLVCGALGCPPITNFAYMPDNLDDMMERQTKLAMNNDDFIQPGENSVGISEIFQWYTTDFETNEQSLIDYINTYRETPIPSGTSLEYYTYNWTLNELKVEIIDDAAAPEQEVSNIFAFTPSKLLKKGQIEAQLYNNLYTETAYRNGEREKIKKDTRDTYYGGLFYMLFGVSKSGRVNIGFDLNVKSVYIDEDKGNPLKVFKFKKTPYSRAAIATLGPKIKFQPLRNVSNFSIQSAFWIPVAKDLESIEEDSDYPWLDYHMYTWWNQFFFDKTFGSNWQIFTEADLLFRFKTKNSATATHMDIPVSFFLSWFPTTKATIYYMIQYAPRFQLQKTENFNEEGQLESTVNPFEVTSDYAHTGLGAKYQVTRNLNLEASYTYFFTSMNGGAGSTYNLGIRIIL